jgi:predicted nucleotidyltransferase
MDKEHVKEIISRFREALKKRGVTAEKIILYGSWAHGTPREGSDIDLVVISEAFRDKGYWERLDLLANAIYDVFEPIEAVALTPEEWEHKDSVICDFAERGELV